MKLTFRSRNFARGLYAIELARWSKNTRLRDLAENVILTEKLVIGSEPSKEHKKKVNVIERKNGASGPICCQRTTWSVGKLYWRCPVCKVNYPK